MVDEQIILSALWICLMLIYLLGDVMRIFAGDFKPGEMDGKVMTQWMLVIMALFMLIPILMIILTLILPYDVIRILTIITGVFLILFNLAGLPYKSLYDNLLIVVSIVFNIITVYYAWVWVN